ncbi:MAG: hypothetical protein PV362_04780 [Providencia heimbachae]|nr:hypothetical protein [Providencia heimbachae]
MIKYTIAVSILNDGIFHYIPPEIIRKKDINLLIIHQIPESLSSSIFENAYLKIKNYGFSVKIIPSFSRGLSKSRNLAIQNCHTKYILFSDDDNSYVNNLVDILDEKTLNKKLQIYSFRIISKEGEYFKKYPKINTTHNNRSILRLSSIENLYDHDFLVSNNIFFNENFGLGAKFPSCEQPIFAKKILSHNGMGEFYPINLAIHPKENSGYDFYNPLQAKTRRKMFLEIYGLKGWFFVAIFYLKK